jgi:hypothetical protein
MLVAVFLTVGFILVVVLIYYRLVRRVPGDSDEEVQEIRASTGGGGLGALLRGAFDRFGHLRAANEGADADSRSAIRRHYRAFQTLMARAGLPRGESQTAREFEAALLIAVPEAAAPLAVLTDAYVLARYADSGAALPLAQVVGEAVMQMRLALRVRDDVSGDSSAGQPHVAD